MIEYKIGTPVRIKDVQATGVWKNKTGKITRIKGPDVYLKLDGHIVVGPFMQEELVPIKKS